MDLIDLWWNLDLQKSIDDLRAKLQSTGVNASETIARQNQLIVLMQKEHDDLRLRVAVLLRLLTAQGTISREQFDAAIHEAKSDIAAAQQARIAQQGASLPRPKPRKPATSSKAR